MVTLKMKNVDSHSVECAIGMIRENWSFASCDKNGVITVNATFEASGSGWGDHTAEENADYIICELSDTFAEVE